MIGGRRFDAKGPVGGDLARTLYDRAFGPFVVTAGGASVDLVKLALRGASPEFIPRGLSRDIRVDLSVISDPWVDRVGLVLSGARATDGVGVLSIANEYPGEEAYIVTNGATIPITRTLTRAASQLDLTWGLINYALSAKLVAVAHATVTRTITGRVYWGEAI